MAMEIFWVDAFTDEPFRGNPAVVCLMPSPGPTEWMQAVAAEMNVSETAFVSTCEDGYSLRWFTPAVEVDLCGHATLASAHAIWEAGRSSREREIRFKTRHHLLEARSIGDEIQLDFPALPEKEAKEPATAGRLAEILGAPIDYLGRSRKSLLVELASEEAVRALEPDHARLGAMDLHGVMVTSRADTAGLDFVSRYFAPGAGIPEDPVTGSAHCVLGPFWSRRLGKDELTAYQASSRGGIVRVRVENDRVKLSGKAITVLRGRLCIEPKKGA